MNIYKRFIQFLQFGIGCMLLVHVLLFFDSECGLGIASHVSAQMEQHVLFEYASVLPNIETDVQHLPTDSTLLSLRLIWTI